MIVVDQLEEVFTVCRDESLRARFLDVLVHAANGSGSRTKVLTAIRADYYGRCAEHAAFAELLGQSNVLVGPMRPDELQRVIEGPARRAGLVLEDGLIERIFDDIGTEPGSLPLLETALLETWIRRSGRTLTLEGYEGSGGVRGAVAHLADDVYARMSSSEQDVARGIFLRLAEPGVGTDDVRRRAPLEELLVDDDHAAVLATLVENRLVVTGDTTVEVAHEALLREWPRLRTWLEEDREGRRIHRALSNGAQEWTAGKRGDDLLFRGSRLAAALDVADAHPTEINPLEREFLAAGRAEQDSELRSARRTAHRFRRLTVALAGLLVVALVAVAFSVVQRSRADQSASRAEAQAEVSDATAVATQARSLVDERLELALLLGVEAHRLHPSVDTEGALETVLAAAPAGVERVITLDPPAALTPNISPDTKLVAAAGNDGVVRLLDTDTGRVVRRLDGPRIAGAIAPNFNRDGSRLAVGSAREDRHGVGHRQRPAPRPRSLPAATDSPTASSTRRTAPGSSRWDTTAPSRAGTCARRRHPRPVDLFTVPAATSHFNLMFDVSIDGRRLLVGDPLTGADLGVGPRRAAACCRSSPAWPGRFGADGETLTTAQRGPGHGLGCGERPARRDADHRRGTPRLLTARSPDDRAVAVTDAFTDRVHVLDVGTGQDVIPAITLHPSVSSARFLPDGRLFTASAERVVIVRPRAPTVAPLGTVLGGTHGPATARRRSPATAAASSPSTNDGTRLWNAATGALDEELPDPNHASSSVFPSPDLRKAAIVDPDGTVRLSGADRGEPGAVLPPEDDHPTSLVWSSDGSTLAVGFAESTLLWRVHDPAHPRQIARLRRSRSGRLGPYLSSVAFSPDDRRVVDRPGVLRQGDDVRRHQRSAPPRVRAPIARSDHERGRLQSRRPHAGRHRVACVRRGRMACGVLRRGNGSDPGTDAPSLLALHRHHLRAGRPPSRHPRRRVEPDCQRANRAPWSSGTPRASAPSDNPSCLRQRREAPAASSCKRAPTAVASCTAASPALPSSGISTPHTGRSWPAASPGGSSPAPSGTATSPAATTTLLATDRRRCPVPVQLGSMARVRDAFVIAAARRLRLPWSPSRRATAPM